MQPVAVLPKRIWGAHLEHEACGNDHRQGEDLASHGESSSCLRSLSMFVGMDTCIQSWPEIRSFDRETDSDQANKLQMSV